MTLDTHNHFPDIRDLALIGDRRTAALVTTAGSIVWYCPGRFDQPSLLAALLDPQRGGEWSLHASSNASFERRRYLEESSILETTLSTPEGKVQMTDWMPLGEDVPSGICRQLPAVPSQVTLDLQSAPDYARRPARLKTTEHSVQIEESWYLYASHPLERESNRVYVTIPAGEPGWAVLAEEALTRPTDADVDAWRETTLESERLHP